MRGQKPECRDHDPVDDNSQRWQDRPNPSRTEAVDGCQRVWIGPQSQGGNGAVRRAPESGSRAVATGRATLLEKSEISFGSERSNCEVHHIGRRLRNLVHALSTTPGTFADGMGCLAAMAALAMAAYGLLGLA